MRPLVLAIVLLASCSRSSDKPSHRQCAEAVAYEWTLSNLEALGGPSELSQEVGKDLAAKPSGSEEEAMMVIRLHEQGATPPTPGDGERRIKECLAGSAKHASCVLHAATTAEIGRCPP